jgi:type II secretory pathway pseudopilin PulG
LIELLIVIAIILIIAAIAIPNFMRSRMAANETAAVSNMRTIVTANVVYSSTYGNGFAPSLLAMTDAGLANCNAAALIDNVLAGGQKSGYGYGYTPGVAVLIVPAGCGVAGTTNFMLTATPLGVGSTGQRSFCTLENGLIRQDPTGALIGVGNCTPPLRPAIQ